jgi:multidrug efflux pump subunit AcrB
VNAAIAWFARNPVAANLLMWSMLISGVLAWPALRQEMFPDIDLEVVTIQVAYPGASPAEVEEALCMRIEEALSGLPGVKRIRSTAAEGVATLSVELHSDQDVARRMADIRARVDAIDNLPDEAERPTVTQAEFPHHVLSIAVAGDVDERTLKRLAEQARDELEAKPEISEVTLASVRPDEVAIEVSELALERHGLSFDQVLAAVRRSSLDLPGGSVRAEGGEILLRARGRATDARGFESIPLLVRPDGSRLRLGDVARVVDGFAESDERATFDGKPAALVQVLSVGDQKAIEVADAAIGWVAAAQARLPEGVEITVWQNLSSYLAERLGSMYSNAQTGFAMVFLLLALFLRLRLAFWVALGVPTAFLGAIGLMPLLGVTINWITLLGFLIVLGILVDDAIVVGENTYTEQRSSPDKLTGAIRGAQGIAVPVVFGVLTTVAAFAPMLFIPGAMGRLVIGLPLVVIACLLFSLLDAMFILPAHLAKGKSLDAPPTHPIAKRWRAFQDRIAASFETAVERGYRPALDRALEWRYTTLALAVGLLIVTASAVASGWLRFVFQEPVEGDLIIADLSMEPGTPAEATAAAVRALEAAALHVQREADATRDLAHGSIFRHVLASVGGQPFRDVQSQMPGGARRGPGSGAHLGEVQVEMIAPDFRDLSTGEMQSRWREAVPDLAGVVELSFHNSMAQSGKPIEIELRGGELFALREAADALKGSLAAYPGVFDVSDSFRGGKPELQFQILPSAEALGLTLADVARQVRQAFQGEEAERIQRGRDDVRVMVRYPPAERRSLGDVEALRIRGADGVAVPFASVAKASLGQGFSAIQRVDRERVVIVTADVDIAVASPNAIVGELLERDLPLLEARFPGVRTAFAGEQAEQRDFLAAMLHGQVLSLIGIYALLAVPLKSYLQPLIIMTVIPFGAVGAALGHLVMGYDLTMYSVIGLVALSGVVVNASLVLVDDVNQRRAAGERVADAVRDAGRGRLRAIFLTELTTFVGLLPMLFERAMFARFMIPLAISLAFGVLFASVITLLIVPCAYVILEDVQLFATGRKRRRAAERIAAARSEQEAAGETGLESTTWGAAHDQPDA